MTQREQLALLLLQIDFCFCSLEYNLHIWKQNCYLYRSKLKSGMHMLHRPHVAWGPSCAPCVKGWWWCHRGDRSHSSSGLRNDTAWLCPGMGRPSEDTLRIPHSKQQSSESRMSIHSTHMLLNRLDLLWILTVLSNIVKGEFCYFST